MQGIAILRDGQPELVAWEGDRAAELLTLQFPALISTQAHVNELHERVRKQDQRIQSLEHQLLVHRMALEKCAKGSTPSRRTKKDFQVESLSKDAQQ